MSDETGAPKPQGEEAPSADQTYQVPAYQDAYPMALRGHAALKDFQKPADVATAYIEASERLKASEGRTYIPGENATSEEWGAFRKGMGVPDSRDGYDLHLPDTMDRDVAGGMADWLKDRAYEIGLPQKATADLFDSWVKDISEGEKVKHETEVRSKQERLDALKKKYGKDWEATQNSAKDFVKKHLGEEVHTSMLEKQLLDDPTYLGALAELSKKIGEDTIPSGSAPPSQAADLETQLKNEMFPNTKYGVLSDQ